MSKFLLCVLLIVMFVCPAISDEKYPEYPEFSENYVEGEVLVVIAAPHWSDYDPDFDAYSEAVLHQAEAIADKYELELYFTTPTTAKECGKSIFGLRSETKSTIEIMNELSSDPDLISIHRNEINEFYPSTEESEESGGCNVGYSSFMLLLLGFAFIYSQNKI